MTRKGKIYLLFILLLTGLCACGQKEQQTTGTGYKVYYVNHDETAIFPEEYRTESSDREIVLEELISQLGVVPDKLEYKVPLGGSFKLWITVL